MHSIMFFRMGAFILQDDLVRFESRLSQYTSASVVGVANATDSLEMIFASLPFLRVLK